PPRSPPPQAPGARGVADAQGRGRHPRDPRPRPVELVARGGRPTGPEAGRRRLPREGQPVAARAGRARDAAPGEVRPMAVRAWRILLAEDDRFLRKAAEATLRQNGFTVLAAVDGGDDANDHVGAGAF